MPRFRGKVINLVRLSRVVTDWQPPAARSAAVACGFRGSIARVRRGQTAGTLPPSAGRSSCQGRVPEGSLRPFA